MWNNYLGKPKLHASESYKNSGWAETRMAAVIVCVALVVFLV